MENSSYSIQEFNSNDGLLYGVIMTLKTGETQLIGRYYKSLKAAEKLLEKSRRWAGEIK